MQEQNFVGVLIGGPMDGFEIPMKYRSFSRDEHWVQAGWHVDLPIESIMGSAPFFLRTYFGEEFPRCLISSNQNRNGYYSNDTKPEMNAKDQYVFRFRQD